MGVLNQLLIVFCLFLNANSFLLLRVSQLNAGQEGGDEVFYV